MAKMPQTIHSHSDSSPDQPPFATSLSFVTPPVAASPSNRQAWSRRVPSSSSRLQSSSPLLVITPPCRQVHISLMLFLELLVFIGLFSVLLPSMPLSFKPLEW
ncbi:hypothetical protein ACOSQ3_009723 [Xanthoceras sorbifolium]